jgi:hypothetical protein
VNGDGVRIARYFAPCWALTSQLSIGWASRTRVTFWSCMDGRAGQLVALRGLSQAGGGYDPGAI